MTFRKVSEKTVFEIRIAKSVTKMGLAREHIQLGKGVEGSGGLGLRSMEPLELGSDSHRVRGTWEGFQGTCERSGSRT